MAPERQAAAVQPVALPQQAAREEAQQEPAVQLVALREEPARGAAALEAAALEAALRARQVRRAAEVRAPGAPRAVPVQPAAPRGPAQEAQQAAAVQVPEARRAAEVQVPEARQATPPVGPPAARGAAAPAGSVWICSTTAPARPAPTSAWIGLPGIYCESVTSCVVVTENTSGGGVIYSASDLAVQNILLTGYAGGARHSFLGLSKTRAGLIAHANRAGSVYAASADFAAAGSWTVTPTGLDDAGDAITTLNDQEAFGVAADGTWRMLYSGVLRGATQAPGATTTWNGLWAPQITPPYPSNFATLKQGDDSICNTEPAGRVNPHPTQVMHVNPDLELLLYPASARNTSASSDPDPPGVCVSTDRGASFRVVTRPGVSDDGPLGVYCTDVDHCWVYNGLSFSSDSHFIFRTTNASLGTAMTWSRSSLPAALVSGGTQLNHIFFAPDNMHGWALGAIQGQALVLRSTDGGATWSDVSTPVRSLAPNTRLSSGFALNSSQIWIGGQNGALLSNGRSGLE